MLKEQGRSSGYFYLHHKSSGFCLRLFFLNILPIPSNTITSHKHTILNSVSPVQIPCLFSTLAYAFSYLTFPPQCPTAIKITTALNMGPLSDLPNLLFLFLCILFSCLCFIIMAFISHYFRYFLFYYILHHFAINEPISHQSLLLPSSISWFHPFLPHFTTITLLEVISISCLKHGYRTLGWYPAMPLLICKADTVCYL